VGNAAWSADGFSGIIKFVKGKKEQHCKRDELCSGRGEETKETISGSKGKGQNAGRDQGKEKKGKRGDPDLFGSIRKSRRKGV